MITRNADPKAITIANTAPITIAMPEPATSAQSRRSRLGRLYSEVVVSATPIGSHDRRNIGSLRGVRGVGLAVLRHPARTSANMASPTIHAA